MSGDEFGGDGWPDGHPDPGHDGGPTEPDASDEHPTGDPHSTGIDPTEVDEPGYPEGDVDGGHADTDYDVTTPDDADEVGRDFGDDKDGEHVVQPPDAGALDDRDRETSLPPASPDRWSEAIGYGATDPGGTHPGYFDHVELSSADQVVGADPEWLTDELSSARTTWVDPDLLDSSGPRESAPLDRAAGDQAVAELWNRLTPGTPMPTDSSGAPDPARALDALEARAGASALRQVIDAARRLLDA